MSSRSRTPGWRLGQTSGTPIAGRRRHWPRGLRGEDPLRAALQGHRRALVYFGFRFDDVPPGFDRLLLQRLSAIGTVRTIEEFTDVGWAVVFDLGVPMVEGWTLPVDTGSAVSPPSMLEGCLDVRPASRW